MQQGSRVLGNGNMASNIESKPKAVGISTKMQQACSSLSLPGAIVRLEIHTHFFLLNVSSPSSAYFVNTLR